MAKSTLWNANKIDQEQSGANEEFHKSIPKMGTCQFVEDERTKSVKWHKNRHPTTRQVANKNEIMTAKMNSVIQPFVTDNWRA